ESLGPVIPTLHLPQIHHARPPVGAADDLPASHEARDALAGGVASAFSDRLQIRLLAGADDVDDLVQVQHGLLAIRRRGFVNGGRKVKASFAVASRLPLTSRIWHSTLSPCAITSTRSSCPSRRAACGRSSSATTCGRSTRLPCSTSRSSTREI